ncbi:MAG: hypothetical protein ACK54H_09545 [Phycisphaerales bacterium]|jgi:hypothetical protein
MESRKLGLMRRVLSCIALVIISGCYRTETTRTSAMGGNSVLADRKYDETPKSRSEGYQPYKKSRVW